MMNEGLISLAQSYHNIDIIQDMIDSGIDTNERKTLDINATVAAGDQPLSIACLHNNLEIVRILIDAKAYVEPNTGITPLHRACQNPNELTKTIIELLIEKNANVNGKTERYGYTPLIVAVSYSTIDIESLTMLLDTHAYPLIEDDRGYNMYQHSCESNIINEFIRIIKQKDDQLFLGFCVLFELGNKKHNSVMYGNRKQNIKPQLFRNGVLYDKHIAGLIYSYYKNT